MLTNTILDYLRYTAYAIVIALSMLLFQAWDKEHAKPATTTAVADATASSTNNYVPTVASTTTVATDTASAAAPTVKTTPIAASTHVIHVVTDVLDVNIDALGGNITQVKLLKYPKQIDSSAPYLLLNDDDTTKYIAQSGLLSNTGPDTSKGQVLYSAKQTSYTLENGKDNVEVNLAWQGSDGTKVTKTFTLHKNSYEINVAYRVENKSTQPWEGNLYLQLMRKNTPPVSNKGIVSLATYFGSAVYDTPQKKFEKITFKQMLQNNLNQTITGGWAAMVEHYFVSAWVPDKNAVGQYFSHVTSDGLYTIGTLGPKIIANPGTVVETQATFYAGPSIADNLEHAAPGLQLTIDYGIFWIIAVSIFWMMQKIYNLVGNWGWSIVLVTLVIKLLFYHLSAKSYRSMSVLKNLQPRINALKERFGDDKQKFTQATIELYKKEKVNPMSGCLPILIQIPVFIGLYWVLIESVQLRQAPFILWIHDLSQKDPYFVLPVLMGLSMFLQQRLNPPPPDPIQAKVMMFLPVIFTALFMNFPAGLMLYWFVNNTLSFSQQWYIMRGINKPKIAK